MTWSVFDSNDCITSASIRYICACRRKMRVSRDAKSEIGSGTMKQATQPYSVEFQGQEDDFLVVLSS